MMETKAVSLTESTSKPESNLSKINWTFTERSSDEYTVNQFKTLLTVVEQKAVITQSDVENLQKKLKELFIERTDGYWYCQARINLLEKKIEKPIVDQVVENLQGIVYPISLSLFDEAAFEIEVTHAYNESNYVTKEWMREWLEKNNFIKFQLPEDVLRAMNEAVQAFHSFWDKFQGINNQAEWKSLMENELGIESKYFPLDHYFEIYKNRDKWDSLLQYQNALKAIDFVSTSEQEIYVPKNFFAKGLLKTEWLKFANQI